jgi:hypothetical protein
MRGSCECGNISLKWRTVDFSIHPRACQCDYCLSQNAAYVSKAGTSVEITLRNSALHRVFEQGTKSAQFHECAGCGDLVAVTAEIEGVSYGAINARCLSNPQGFAAAVKSDVSAQSAAEKQKRWRENWCYPVVIRQS